VVVPHPSLDLSRTVILLREQYQVIEQWVVDQLNGQHDVAHGHEDHDGVGATAAERE